MKEDLGMYGNELNYMQTCWTVGYVLGEIPSNILLTRVRPRYWIPAAEVGRSFQALRKSLCLLTQLSFYGLFWLSVSQDATHQLSFTSFDFSSVWSSPYSLHRPGRKKTNLVISGLAESTFYPGMQYIIGSWYRKDELAKRSCIFHTSSGIASMFSGYLMDAVFKLGGRGGFKGWQWYETKKLLYFRTLTFE